MQRHWFHAGPTAPPATQPHACGRAARPACRGGLVFRAACRALRLGQTLGLLLQCLNVAQLAERFWQQWCRRAMRSRIAPLKQFASNLKKLLPGILAHCHWPLGTNLIERINNKIRSSRGSPMAPETTLTSSSKSGPHSPESGEEPKKGLPVLTQPLSSFAG